MESPARSEFVKIDSFLFLDGSFALMFVGSPIGPVVTGILLPIYASRVNLRPPKVDNLLPFSVRDLTIRGPRGSLVPNGV